MKAMILALALTFCAPLAARAEEDAAARAARWQDLRHAVFGDRAVGDGAGVIALEAPARALDAALVPVGVTIAGDAKVKAIYLLVDGNPSPLAGTFRFGPAGDPRQLKTPDQGGPGHARCMRWPRPRTGGFSPPRAM